MSNFLFLASQSKTRKKLLTSTRIAYESFFHNSNELVNDESVLKNAAKYVEYVAALKYNSLDFNTLFQKALEKKLDSFFVLVCDTMIETESKEILGKPVDRDQIILFHDLLNEKKTSIHSSFILAKFKLKDDAFMEQEKTQETIKTDVIVSISRQDSIKYIEKYKDLLLTLAGGFSIEGYGAQFIKEIHGSYTNALGLPLEKIIKLIKS